MIIYLDAARDYVKNYMDLDCRKALFDKFN